MLSIITLISLLWVESFSAVSFTSEDPLDLLSSYLIQVQSEPDTSRVDALIGKIRKYRFSEPDRAKIIADSALIIARISDFKTREAEILNQMGIIASVQGDSPKALEHFLEVLRVREEIGDLSGIARIQNNLGVLYKNLGDFDRSLEFHSASLNSKRKLGDSLGISRSLNNIGEIYQQKEQTDTSKEYFEEALGLMLRLDFKEGLAAVYNNLGEVYKLQGDIRTAINYHSQSLEIEKELGNTPGIGISYLNIASLFLLVNQPQIAISNYKEAVGYFKVVNDLPGLEKAYKDLATTYSEIGNFEESLYYFQLQSDLKDSLSSIETNRQLAELQTKYESEKQTQEIALLSERSNNQENQIAQQSKTRNLLIIITVLLFVIVFILFRSNRLRKKTNELLVQKNKEIEKAAELKEQFLSVMSHEIRTPMNAVVGMTNLLLSESPRDDQKEYLETLKFSSNSLLRIVNDVLDYNKAGSGKIELESIGFRPLFLFSSVYQSFYHQAIEKGIHLTVNPDEKIPEFLKGDPTRLTQILNNLISNALKFTDEGSVTVDVSLIDQTEQEAVLNFRVSDTGIGIEESKREVIFESFIQASKETHRKYGGSGLGLAITKKLVELYGGELKVVSTIGKGTSFSFSISFPKAKASQMLNEKRKDLNALESLKGIRVLLVEDNPVNIQVIRQFLKKWDINLEICVNGEYAIDAVKQNRFDLILMDLHMPIMDGYQATQIIRSMEKKAIKEIPIVALTASNIFEEHEQAYEAGVNEIVPKPFDPSLLHDTILKYSNRN
ncbi:MAG: tetratricopeptide repeat protein [Balneolaceae bacterium]|nr:tetratricopeptide repeat protein [Balneolaceae bacterium]MBO6546454.1 tetratricopeptide repeat protein [Balneolaceae bacterium]MBO6648813.1 tetratricopeptide repeat protein [Balneolaceae bacterium]